MRQTPDCTSPQAAGAVIIRRTRVRGDEPTLKMWHIAGAPPAGDAASSAAGQAADPLAAARAHLAALQRHAPSDKSGARHGRTSTVMSGGPSPRPRRART
jgi:hypothetical protein